ncbi:cytochrome P450 4F4-like isoform X1 [Amphiura filiformis]|uniref:cytochrome P450 4F4-like isoform X1 n=1 Tax=Amphiura filiformis TaxID=82378 RepID=UPI003B212E23
MFISHDILLLQSMSQPNMAILDVQNLAGVALIFFIIATVKLCSVLLSNFQRRWKLQEISKGIEYFGWEKEPHFLYGNLKEIPKDEKDRIDALIKQSTVCTNTRQFWIGPFVCIMTMLNPEYIRLVLANADTKDSIFYQFLKHWLGDGLLINGGGKWTRHRRLLTPAFHFEILRPYVKLSVESTNVFLNKLMATKGECIDVYNHVSLMTLDTLLKCSFSYESNCQSDTNNPYIESVYAMAELLIKRLTFLPHHIDFIYRLSSSGRQFFKHCRRVHEKAEEFIRNRRNELARLAKNDKEDQAGKKRRYLDFLDVLIQARDEDGNGLKDLEIREEVDTFLFEGHDTTASGVSWCLYNLARFPQFQQKCRDEVNELLTSKNKEELDWDDLNQLPFLTMFIKESLRFHPPVPGVARTLIKDITLPNGVFLPKGTSVGLSVLSTHHHPLYWDDPEVFDPYRFTPENNAKRHSHAFIPFSAGPRNCIGQHFAMNELKIVAAMTLRRFMITPDEKNPPQWISRLVLRSCNGIHLRFTPAIH